MTHSLLTVLLLTLWLSVYENLIVCIIRCEKLLKLLTLGAHAQRRLQYLSCVCVCVCVCVFLSVPLG